MKRKEQLELPNQFSTNIGCRSLFGNVITLIEIVTILEQEATGK